MSSDIYDKNLSLELAGGNPDLAEQMFDMLRNGLPGQKEAINDAYAGSNMDELYKHVHKITGSTRYCGVPALADASEVLDKQLKSGAVEQLDLLIKNLNEEIDRLIDYAD